MQDEMTCPLCGAGFDTEIPDGLKAGDSVEIECPCCGEPFSLEIESDGKVRNADL